MYMYLVIDYQVFQTIRVTHVATYKHICTKIQIAIHTFVYSVELLDIQYHFYMNQIVNSVGCDLDECDIHVLLSYNYVQTKLMKYSF